MSSFRDPLLLEFLDAGRYRVIEPFTYWLGEGTWSVTVPKGAETDFASVPRIFWPIIRPDGRHGKAAVVHDYLYRVAPVSRVVADAIFLDAMATLGVSRWRRWSMYLAVRLFGGRAFKWRLT